MDRERLEAELRAAFDGSDAARRVVARQTCDLADSGREVARPGYEQFRVRTDVG